MSSYLTLKGQAARLSFDPATGTVSLEALHAGVSIEFAARELPSLMDALHGLAVTLAPLPRTCRVCGCTDDDACVSPDGDSCCWVDVDLCSACAEVAA